MSEALSAPRPTRTSSVLLAFLRIFRRRPIDGEVLEAVSRIGLPADLDTTNTPAISRSHAARCVLQAIRAVHGGRIPADTASIDTVVAPFAPTAPIRQAIETIADTLPGDICFRPIRKALEKLGGVAE
jgi:hypothetical protein